MKSGKAEKRKSGKAEKRKSGKAEKWKRQWERGRIYFSYSNSGSWQRRGLGWLMGSKAKAEKQQKKGAELTWPSDPLIYPFCQERCQERG